MKPFLEKGDEVEIADAKAEYRRIYKAKWKKANRGKFKEVTVRFNQDEYKEIQTEAKRHHQKLAPFMKASSIAYIRKTYIIPDTDSINKILQLLKMMYIKVEDMIEDKGNGEVFLQALNNLECDMRIALLSPIDIEMAAKKLNEKSG